MLRLGDWVQIGDRKGCIQAYGIERGIAPNSKQHPIKRVSRKAAYASSMPHVLIWFNNGDEEWWPLEATIAIPAPLIRAGRGSDGKTRSQLA